MRIAVTGANGQIARSLAECGRSKGYDVVPLTRPAFDLADITTITSTILAANPDIVISAAAYTAVDKAESEPELAEAVNGIGAGAVAEAAQALGIPIVHLSTDYVFDGTKPSPYVETDPTSPLNVYGRSKLSGERRVMAATENHVILRVAWVYSPYGSNFVRTMLRLAETREAIDVVGDQWGGPTSAADIAEAIIAISARLVADRSVAYRGLFHLPPRGEATWAEFAKHVFQLSGAHGRRVPTVRAITTADYPTPAKRPANSRLDGRKLEDVYRIILPDWRESLARCVDLLSV